MCGVDVCVCILRTCVRIGMTTSMSPAVEVDHLGSPPSLQPSLFGGQYLHCPKEGREAPDSVDPWCCFPWAVREKQTSN